MRRVLSIISLLAVLAGAGMAGAGTTAAPLSTPELKQVIGSGKKSTIVFFQNPQGGPCMAQKEILEKLHKERKGSFNIANVSTMKPEDERAFYEYGIRGLPSLILVDKSGNISRVFPPGIQTAETLAPALDGLK
jgi:thioredoxin-like negative regulator of GroEL